MDERPLICQVTCIHAKKNVEKKSRCFQCYTCCSTIGDGARMQLSSSKQRSSTEQI